MCNSYHPISLSTLSGTTNNRDVEVLEYLEESGISDR